MRRHVPALVLVLALLAACAPAEGSSRHRRPRRRGRARRRRPRPARPRRRPRVRRRAPPRHPATPAPTATPTPEPTASPEPKPYAINLASAADFVPQYTFEWCVGASIMMARSIITDSRNESRASQRRLWELARDLTIGSPYGGANPAGWAAALNELGPRAIPAGQPADVRRGRGPGGARARRRPAAGRARDVGRPARLGHDRVQGDGRSAQARRRARDAGARDGPALPARLPVGREPGAEPR